jgi:hypothetical protein
MQLMKQAQIIRYLSSMLWNSKLFLLHTLKNSCEIQAIQPILNMLEKYKHFVNNYYSFSISELPLRQRPPNPQELAKFMPFTAFQKYLQIILS